MNVKYVLRCHKMIVKQPKHACLTPMTINVKLVRVLTMISQHVNHMVVHTTLPVIHVPRAHL